MRIGMQIRAKKRFFAFFCRKIWLCQKKAVPLRDFSCNCAKNPRI